MRDSSVGGRSLSHGAAAARPAGLGVQVVQEKGLLQRIHVIVCTYSEPPATVERCVQHLLDSTLPVYAERVIWVADDGHDRPEGAGKRAFVERMRAQGPPPPPLACMRTNHTCGILPDIFLISRDWNTTGRVLCRPQRGVRRGPAAAEGAAERQER